VPELSSGHPSVCTLSGNVVVALEQVDRCPQQIPACSRATTEFSINVNMNTIVKLAWGTYFSATLKRGNGA
jgi:hypothetical protein